MGAAIAASFAFAGAAEACPNWELQPSFGQITLNAGFLPDPYARNVTAGGQYSLAACGFNWQGHVAQRPDFDLYYGAGGYSLTIYVTSGYDTVLLVNAPDGRWYYSDDDGGGLNPSITFRNPQSGLYDIWIGAYDNARGLPAQLLITEY
jgi:hypothetical protein